MLFKILESVLKYVTAVAKTNTTENQKKKRGGKESRGANAVKVVTSDSSLPTV